LSTKHSKTILITGGLGYLGGRIANHISLQETNTHLKISTTRSINVQPEWLSNAEIISLKLNDKDKIKNSLENIETVIHLASVNELLSAENPELAFQINTIGTYNLLEGCRIAGVKKFIYLSTFHVYGLNNGEPITELSATRPIHPYAITHRSAEDIVNWYHHSYGLKTLIFRLSNGFGYPMDLEVNRWSLVFNDFCNQAVKEKQIQIQTSGKQHRNFIALNDICRAISHFLNLEPEQWNDGLFNLGGEASMSIIDAAELVNKEYKKIYGDFLPIKTGNDHENTIHHPVLFDISKLKKTGFSLSNEISNEIQQTFKIAHLRNLINNQI
jgi:UDP-glucose 4-epimerase